MAQQRRRASVTDIVDSSEQPPGRRRARIRSSPGTATSFLPGAQPSVFAGAPPAQIDPAGTVTRFPAGELRGVYGSRWKPRWSTFGHPRSGGGHNGVDIYAPSGTALVAVVDGQLTFKSGTDGDGLGNRAWLSFRAGGKSLRFIYGHLSAFAGGSRSVRGGEVIGYAGCSGNADYAGDCTKPGACGLTSGHVHLILIDDTTGQTQDPASALDWRLRYVDDQRDVPCLDVVRRRLGPAPSAVEIAARVRDYESHARTLEEVGTPYAAALAQGIRAGVRAWLADPENVDTGANAKTRASQFYALAGAVVELLNPDSAPDLVELVQRFLLRVAWHEGDQLRTRVQYENGPARSFFQIEAARARDDLLRLAQSRRLAPLASIAGVSVAELEAAASALPNRPSYPKSNLVREQLENSDRFGIALARLAFSLISAAIPGSIVGQADYWYRHWKRTGGDADALKKAFAEKAAALDQLLGLDSLSYSSAPWPTSLAEHEAQAAAAAADRVAQRSRVRSVTASLPAFNALASARKLSERAFSLILQHESGGHDYYVRFGARPHWPGVSSGVTIGMGFDLGYRSQAELTDYFKEHLGHDAVARLAVASGTHAGQGSAAVKRIKTWLAELADIEVPWTVALQVLRDKEAPHQSSITERTFGPVEGLPDDAFGALVSLVFNRGPSMQGERRREMRAIRDSLAASDFAAVPAHIRAMKRLWPDVPSLQKRREDEAELFEQALAEVFVFKPSSA